MISWERVRELRDEIGADDFRDVVQIFLEEVEEVISRLRLHPESLRPDEDFHFLKGSALNLGFVDLGDLCHDGERHPNQVELATVLAVFEASKTDFMRGAARLGIEA